MYYIGYAALSRLISPCSVDPRGGAAYYRLAFTEHMSTNPGSMLAFSYFGWSLDTYLLCSIERERTGK